MDVIWWIDLGVIVVCVIVLVRVIRRPIGARHIWSRRRKP